MTYLYRVKKWVSIFFLLLVAAGSFIPCCAEDDCATEVSATTDKGHSGDDETGCSPFFACGTCAPAIVVHTPVPVNQQPFPEKVTYQFVADDGLAQYHPSFFQPPRQ